MRSAQNIYFSLVSYGEICKCIVFVLFHQLFKINMLCDDLCAMMILCRVIHDKCSLAEGFTLKNS